MIKQLIEQLIEKECNCIDIYLKNGGICNLWMSESEITIQDDGLISVSHLTDGCTYESYIPYESISYVTGIYNCPELFKGEEDE